MVAKKSAIVSSLLGQSSSASPSWRSRARWLGILSQLWAPVSLVVLTAFLIWLNHVPNTWLTGWDTLHPEFNFGLNLQRVLSGVWRADQGLGTVATHAHVVELPRILILWIFSWIMPLQFVRYAYIGLCFILGPLGIYACVHHLLKPRYHPVIARTASWCAALFYIFNLATLQHFVVPFEMFPTNYAATGWLFYLIFLCLEKPTLKRFLALLLLNFWASNLAYSFISWYVYFGGVTAFLITYGSLTWLKTRANVLTPALAIWAIILVANLYWILPNFYFVTQHAWHVPFAKNNQLISEEIYYHNKEFGTLGDTITMKNHLFNWKVKDGETVVPLLSTFATHLTRPLIGFIPYIFFGVMLVGIFSSIVPLLRRKHATATDLFFVSLLPMTVGCMLMFLSLNQPLETWITPLRDHISILREGLRNPFIKFNLLMLYGYAMAFGVGMAILLNLLKKMTRDAVWPSAFGGGAVLVLCLLFGAPFFTGHLIDRRVQQSIPPSYFTLFKWFQTQRDDLRVLVLPAPEFWAWEYRTWGYQGAGFLWFGLPQPLFSRDSDRWNPYNEEAYREINFALQQRNKELFLSLLEKYHVGWVIFDKSVTTAGNNVTNFDLTNLQEFLSTNELAKTTFSDQLMAYTVTATQTKPAAGTLSQAQSAIGPAYMWQYFDQAWKDLGNYITSDKNAIHYPFRAVLTATDKVDPSIVSLSDNQLHLTMPSAGGFATLPLTELRSISARAFILREEESVKVKIVPELLFGQNVVKEQEVTLPLAEDVRSFTLAIDNYLQDVTLNENETTTISQLSLSLDTPTTIRIFENDFSEPVTQEFSTNSTTVYSCQTGEDSDRIDARTSGRDLTISVRKDTACATRALMGVAAGSIGSATNSAVLARATASFAANNQLPMEWCLLDSTTQNCISSSQTRGDVTTQATAQFRRDQLSSLAWLFSVANPNTEAPLRSSLTKLEISITPMVAEARLTWDITAIDRAQILSVPVSQTLSIPLDQAATTIQLGEIDHPAINCAPESRSEVDRTVQSERSERYVRYKAKYGMSCDHILLGQLQPQGYFISVRSRNIAGLTARMCVRNQFTGICDAYIPLGTQKEFVTEKILLPPPRGATPYILEFLSFAPGKDVSVNDIASVELQPIPFTLLSQVRWSSTQLPPSQSLTTPTSIVQNYQSYEPGWVGLQASLWPPRLSVLSDHVLLNNWENAWVVSSDQSGNVVFFFWPQLLEWGGLLLLIGTLAGFGGWAVVSNKKLRHVLTQPFRK